MNSFRLPENYFHCYPESNRHRGALIQAVDNIHIQNYLSIRYTDSLHNPYHVKV